MLSLSDLPWGLCVGEEDRMDVEGQPVALTHTELLHSMVGQVGRSGYPSDLLEPNHADSWITHL